MISVFCKCFLALLLIVSSALLSTTPVFAGQAILSWSSNTAPDLAGYVLYYKDDSNNLPLTKMQFTQKIVISAGQTNYTKMGLIEGTHRFALTAFDTSSNESGLSVVVQKTVSPSSAQNAEEAMGGGGGCGIVFPTSGGNGKPPGPGDAAGMLLLFGTSVLLLIKKAFQTNLQRLMSTYLS